MWSIMSKNVRKYVALSLNAVLSGIMISVGGAVYLMCENKIIGSFLFSFGYIHNVAANALSQLY